MMIEREIYYVPALKRASSRLKISCTVFTVVIPIPRVKQIISEVEILISDEYYDSDSTTIAKPMHPRPQYIAIINLTTSLCISHHLAVK